VYIAASSTENYDVKYYAVHKI